MSLFKLNEWYSTIIPNASCITVGQLTKGRDQLCIGSEDGLLTIVDPGGTEKKEDAVLLQQELQYPVIQIAIGEFLNSINVNLLAALSTHNLTLYRLVQANNDNSVYRLEEVYSHSMKEQSYNMCVVQGKTPQIFVQGISCGLTLFEGDQCVFSRTPLPALHPGPLVYCSSSQSLVITNAGRVNSIKFSLLASLSNTGKKITFDWTFNLGDVALDMAAAEWGTVQPSLVVLCRRTLYCITTGGNIRYTIHLECIGMSLLVYNSLSSPKIHMCIATSTNTILIYKDNELVWNCQTGFAVVDLTIGSFGESYPHILCLLSNEGKVVAGYLGTEPSLFRLPVAPTRFVDFMEKTRIMKNMEREIKDSGGGNVNALQTQTKLKMICEVDDLDKPSLAYNVPSDVPSITARITFDGATNSGQFHMNIRSEFKTQQKHFVISGKDLPLSVTFFVADHIPSTLDVYCVAHNSQTQISCFHSFRLPLCVLFKDTSPERNALYKLTIDADRSVLPLNQIFHEFQTENPSSIGLQVCGSDAVVSIFTANKSNRYRIQTDTPELLYVIANELVERLYSVQHGVVLSAGIPLEYIVPKLEEFIELEDRAVREKHDIDGRCKEVRSIQALLITRTKASRPQSTSHIDTLFDSSHQQLLSLMESHLSTRDKINSLRHTVSSLFDLLKLLLKLNNVDAPISSLLVADTNQSIRDRLNWSSNTSETDVGRILAALCQNTMKSLTNITEEEDEENNEREVEDEFALGGHAAAARTLLPDVQLN